MVSNSPKRAITLDINKITRHFTEDGLKTLTSAVGDNPDPCKIIDEALNVSISFAKCDRPACS